MATRPAFQFYPADWRNNANLRRCSEAARGAWMDVLCLLHDSDEYGVLRWPLADIAQAAGLPINLLQELARKSVLKGADSGAEPYVFAPSHAGKAGDPVTLVAVDDGPCWYCSRFVKDEYVRQRRGANTRFTSDNQPPNPQPKPAPKVGIGGRQGDGASSSSSITSTEQEQKQGKGGKPPMVLPEWLPADAWADWHSYRNARKGWTRHARELSLRTLTELHTQGHSPRAVIERSIERGWTGLFAPGAPPPAGKPSAAADFRGKSYESTPIDQLPADLRAAAERALRDDG